VTADSELRTAYRYAGESEWCRLGAIDKADNVVRLCEGVPHATIVDIGAGEGSVLARLAELGFGDSHYAVEVSETAAAVIRSRGIPSLADCRCFDGERLPHPDGAFDLAILSHVVEHVEYPRKLIYEAARVARHVFVEVPLEQNLRLPAQFVADDLGHINTYSPKSIRRLLQSCGLEVICEAVSHRSRATYTYHGDALGSLKFAVKELALRLAPGLATAVWTYHGALLCRPAPSPPGASAPR
jgi:SAM-dependent methyltransferase